MKPSAKKIMIYIVVGLLLFGLGAMASVAIAAAATGNFNPGFFQDLFSFGSGNRLTKKERQQLKQAKKEETTEEKQKADKSTARDGGQPKTKTGGKSK